GSAVGVGIKHISEPIPRLPEHLSIFQPIVDRALAKNPDDRYQSGSEFIADLDALPADLILLAMELNELPTTLDDDPHSPTMIKPRPILTDEQLAGVDARTSAESSGFSAILDDVTAQGLYASLNSTGVDDHVENLSLSAADLEAHRHHRAPRRGKKNRFSPSFLMLALLIVSGAYWLLPGISDYWRNAEPQQSATEHNQARIYDPDRVASRVNAVDKAAEKTSAETQVINGTDVTVDNFRQKTQPLRLQLDEDVSMAGGLASVYQAALNSTDPELQKLGQAGLQEMQAFYVARINALMNAGELAQSQAYAGSAQRLFEEPRRVSSLVDALAAVDSAAELISVLDQAEEYLQQGALDAPEGSNALESYRKVLRDYPKHPLALGGLHNIAQAYR